MDEPTDRWLTVEDITTMLHVHEQTVRRWLREGHLRGVLLGRKAGYRVRESDLNAYLDSRAAGRVDAGKVAA